MSYDYLIVGAGFTGSTMARLLADAGKRVLIVDKRDHIGGNAYDYVNEHGVRIHKYGPHIFHTNSDKVLAFLSRFTEWRPYEHRVLSSVNGSLVPFPINLDTLNHLYGPNLTEEKARALVGAMAKRDYHGGPVETAEDQIVSQIGRELFDLFFAGYTQKMWGRPARELDKSVTARIPIRFNKDDRYFTDKHQCMPRDGYTALFERMLDHANIEVRLGAPCDSGHGGGIPQIGDHHTIWTGPVCEYFRHCLGPLPYRSLTFNVTEWPPMRYVCGGPATINQPSSGEALFTRATDMARLTGVGQPGTAIMYEYPTSEGEPYYPIPSPESQALYKRYRDLADKEKNVTFLGRLGTYQYLNMDQAIGQAMAAAGRLLA